MRAPGRRDAASTMASVAPATAAAAPTALKQPAAMAPAWPTRERSLWAARRVATGCRLACMLARTQGGWRPGLAPLATPRMPTTRRQVLGGWGMQQGVTICVPVARFRLAADSDPCWFPPAGDERPAAAGLRDAPLLWTDPGAACRCRLRATPGALRRLWRAHRWAGWVVQTYLRLAPPPAHRACTAPVHACPCRPRHGWKV